MTEFALIDTSSDDTIIDIRSYETQPPDPEGKPRKWLPVERTQDALGPNQVFNAPSDPVVGADKVTIHTAARDMTEDEIKAATPRVPTYVIVRRLEAANLIDAADAALSQNKVLFRRFYTVGAILVTDPDARGFLSAIGADPDAILAPEV